MILFVKREVPREWWAQFRGWTQSVVTSFDCPRGGSRGTVAERILRVARAEESSRIRACRRVASRVRPVLRASAYDSALSPVIKARGARVRVCTHPPRGSTRARPLYENARRRGGRATLQHARDSPQGISPSRPLEITVPSRRGSCLDYQQVSRARARPVGIVDDPRPPVRSVYKPSHIPRSPLRRMFEKN